MWRLSRFGSMDHLQDDDEVSLAGTARVHHRTAMLDDDDSFFGGSGTRNIEEDLFTWDVLSGTEELNLAMLNQRAAKRFLGGAGAPSPASKERLAQLVTLLLLKFAKEAAHDLFIHHYEEVQRSWGSPIDEEEAVGYLVADALALELVP